MDGLPDADADVIDSRVLGVVFDDQGERFRPWRDVAPALTSDGYSDWPVRTVMWLCKQFSSSNLGQQQWLERFLATACWSDTDRSVHEFRSIARYIETGRTYVNLAALAMVEEMSR